MVARRPRAVAKVVLRVPDATELLRAHARRDVALLVLGEHRMLADRDGGVGQIDVVAVLAQQPKSVVEGIGADAVPSEELAALGRDKVRNEELARGEVTHAKKLLVTERLQLKCERT